MHTPRWLLLISAVLVMGIVTSVTLPSGAEGKRVSNPMGFSIEVPSGWQVGNNERTSPTERPVLEVNGNKAELAQFTVQVKAWKGKTLEDSVKLIRQEALTDKDDPDGSRILEDRPVMIGTLQGHRFVWTCRLEHKLVKAHTTLVVAADTEFCLSGGSLEEAYDKLAPIYEKMTASFRLDK